MSVREQKKFSMSFEIAAYLTGLVFNFSVGTTESECENFLLF